MRCCKSDILLLRQLAQWFWWTLQHRVRNVHQLLIIKFRWSPTSFSIQHRFFSVSLQTALRWGTGVSGNFSPNCYCTISVYLLASQNMYSTRKTHSATERTAVSKNWIKQLCTHFTSIALQPLINN
jgi:hypothetical protein